MKLNKKQILIISGVLVFALLCVILINNFSHAAYTNEQANTIFDGNSLIKTLYNIYINGEEASSLSFDDVRSTCSKGGTITYEDGTIISEGRYQEICNIFLNLEGMSAPSPLKGQYLNAAIPTLASNVLDGGNGVIKDDYNNYRYVGAIPDNYIIFNNELWRIIGVFNSDSTGNSTPLVKIMRNDPLPIYATSWDYKKSGVGSSSNNNGSNYWGDSTLMMLLNPKEYIPSSLYSPTPASNVSYTYDEATDSVKAGSIKIFEHPGSYYYASSNGTIVGNAGITTTAFGTQQSYDFSKIGLNETARSMIQEVTWPIRGYSSASATSNTFYNYERTTGSVYNSNWPTTWTGKVGLMYPSDYGYSSSGGNGMTRSSCASSINLGSWNSLANRGCPDNSWIYKHGMYQWTMSPYTSYAYTVFYVNFVGSLSSSTATNYSNGVSPVLYLKSSIKVSGGDGSASNPYVVE